MADMTQIAEQLEKERAGRLHEVKVLDSIIAELRALGTAPAVRKTRSPAGPSVRSRTLALMEENDRDWATNEVVAEYENRGVALNSEHPANAVRSSIADLLTRGLIERSGTGRYRATKFAHGGRDEVVAM